MHLRFGTIGVVFLGLVLAGCSSSLTGDLPAGAPSPLPALPSLPSLGGAKVVGTPTELYTRIARGAVTCWFGASGPLKGSYIYHADATPESKGGGSEITIFGKDTSVSTDPRATKAFQVAIRPTGGTPEIGVENIKVPEPLASRLKQDVGRWAAGEETCGSGAITQGWDARDRTKTSKTASPGKKK
jgi:hypothetical protein